MDCFKKKKKKSSFFAAILMQEVLTDFGVSAVGTRLSENGDQAVGFHPQIFNQLQMETAF